MGSLSPIHWLIVVVVLVVLFGAKRLPDASRSIGRSLRIFKSEMKDMNADDKPAESTPPPAAPTTAAPTTQQLPAAPSPVVPPTTTQHVQAERIEKAS